MNIPTSQELRTLPVSPKSQPHGVVAWCVLTFLRICAALRWNWAHDVYHNFHQYIDGRIYAAPNSSSVTDSTRNHEAVHDWQIRTEGAIRFVLKYYLSKQARAHYEAAAYACEVVWHGRSRQNAARAMTLPAYRLGLTPQEAEALLAPYIYAYSRHAKERF